MLETGNVTGKGKPTFTWRDSVLHEMLVAIREAEAAAVRKEGHVLELLLRELQANADLKTLLANRPRKGEAHRIITANVLEMYRKTLHGFVREVTKEVVFH